MSTIRVESTTDTQEQVNAVLGIKPAEPTPEQSVADQTPAVAAPVAAAEVQKADEPVAAKPAEAPKADEDDENDDLDDAERASRAGRALAQHKSRVQKRIDKITLEKHTALSEARQAKKQAETLAKELEEARRKTATTETPADEPSAPAAVAPKFEKVKPKQEDFETFDEYETAKDDWLVEKTKFDLKVENEAHEKEVRERAAREGAEQAIRDRDATFHQRVDVARKKYADFDTVMTEAKDLQVTGAMRAYMEESESGAELLYFLATHPQEAERISALPTVRAAGELGKLEVKLESGTIGAASDTPPAAPVVTTSEPTPAAVEAPAQSPELVAAGVVAATAPKTPVSRAPAPMTRPGGAGTSGITKRPEDMTHAEYKAWRAAGGGT